MTHTLVVHDSITQVNPDLAEATTAAESYLLIAQRLGPLAHVVAVAHPGGSVRLPVGLLGRLGLSAMEATERKLLLDLTHTQDGLDREQLITDGVIGLIALIGGCLAALLFTPGGLRRLRRLEANAKLLDQGAELPPIEGRDELGRLRATLAEVNQLFIERKDARARSEARLESVVSNTPNTVFAKDAQDLRYTLLNRAVVALLEAPRLPRRHGSRPRWLWRMRCGPMEPRESSCPG
ncbi:MAG: hypothetical protein ACYDB7_07190 [Mycobacteriales bacterium]